MTGKKDTVLNFLSLLPSSGLACNKNVSLYPIPNKKFSLKAFKQSLTLMC